MDPETYKINAGWDLVGAETALWGRFDRHLISGDPAVFKPIGILGRHASD
jgi:hypothetical protein